MLVGHKSWTPYVLSTTKMSHLWKNNSGEIEKKMPKYVVSPKSGFNVVSYSETNLDWHWYLGFELWKTIHIYTYMITFNLIYV